MWLKIVFWEQTLLGNSSTIVLKVFPEDFVMLLTNPKSICCIHSTSIRLTWESAWESTGQILDRITSTHPAGYWTTKNIVRTPEPLDVLFPSFHEGDSMGFPMVVWFNSPFVWKMDGAGDGVRLYYPGIFDPALDVQVYTAV